MTNYTLYKRYVNYFLCLILLIISGCGSIKNIPTQNYQSSNDEVIMFGRLEIIVNGQEVPIKTVILHLNPQSESTRYIPKYHIELRRDGYFFAALPVGNYIVHSISRKSFFSKMCDSCDYFNLLHEDNISMNLTLTPDKATYIGTVQAFVTTKAIEKSNMPIGCQLQLFNPSSPVGDNIGAATAYSAMELINATNTIICNYLGADARMTVKWQIKNEIQEASYVFKDLYSYHPDPVENLAVFAIKK